MKKCNLFPFRTATLICLALFEICQISKGQAARSSDYPNTPSWVNMMSNPNVNYFAAVKAYEEYWKHHEKPMEEEEQMGEQTKDHQEKSSGGKTKHEKEVEREKDRAQNKTVLTSKEIKELEWKQEMTYQCKRFEDWMRSVKPFIQSDGRILSAEEQMEIYEKRQQELNKNNK